MATEAPFKGSIPEFDYQKEVDRWANVVKLLSEPEPKVGQTPRTEVWRKNKSVLWHYPAKQKSMRFHYFLCIPF